MYIYTLISFPIHLLIAIFFLIFRYFEEYSYERIYVACPKLLSSGISGSKGKHILRLLITLANFP